VGSDTPERELTLEAGPEFQLPSLFGVDRGLAIRLRSPERLVTTYYDTEDLRLARWGANLRQRRSEGWTVELPAESSSPVLARSEITVPGEGDSPPDELVDLVRGLTRAADLRARTRLSTRRRRVELFGTGPEPLAGVVEDDVSVHHDGHASRSAFREIEVEIGDATTPALLDALVARLRLAGAGAASSTSRYIRSLDPGASPAPEVEVPELRAGSASVGDVVRDAIARSVVRLIRHDPIVRLDTDPEGVRRARVATRRLRSDLRTFRKVVDDGWATSLRDELGWLASLLGTVRDGDVLLERLRRHALELPDAARPGATEVLATLEAARDGSHRTLLETIRGERYLALLERLIAAANDPALRPEAGAPAEAVLRTLARRPWHSLERHVAALGASPSDEELHDIRIRTERARYAAEAAAPLLGPHVRAFAKAAARLQDVLGELNGAVVAESWLREWVQAHASSTGATAATGLMACERAEAERWRRAWRDAWEELASPELHAWM